MTLALIHDCDNACGVPGRDVDDALALLYLLGQPSIALRGVTTCFGNAGLPAVLRVTRRLLENAGHPGLPLLAGAAAPGLAATPAARFLVEATAAEPGRLVILATGPLTNLAAAAALDPGFFGRCAGILCLGGSLGPARLGWRGLRELNFEADADAARRILATRDCPVTVVPATSCVGLRLGWRDLPLLPPLVRGAVRNWLLCCGVGRGLLDMVAWDLLPALALTHPALLDIDDAEVTLAEAGVIAAATTCSRHRLVRGVRDPALARVVVLTGLRGCLALLKPSANPGGYVGFW
jgi:inosine-uridine nucleoside N-ribohydrolase